MAPHRSLSNSVVKGYSGEDTKERPLWENSTKSNVPVIVPTADAGYMSGEQLQIFINLKFNNYYDTF